MKSLTSPPSHDAMYISPHLYTRTKKNANKATHSSSILVIRTLEFDSFFPRTTSFHLNMRNDSLQAGVRYGKINFWSCSMYVPTYMDGR